MPSNWSPTAGMFGAKASFCLAPSTTSLRLEMGQGFGLASTSTPGVSGLLGRLRTGLETSFLYEGPIASGLPAAYFNAVGARGTGSLADGPTRVPDEPASTDAVPAASATAANAPTTIAARPGLRITFIPDFPSPSCAVPAPATVPRSYLLVRTNTRGPGARRAPSPPVRRSAPPGGRAVDPHHAPERRGGVALS